MINNMKSINVKGPFQEPSCSCQLSMEFLCVFRGHAWSEGCWLLWLCLQHRIITTYREAAHKQRCRIPLAIRISSGKGPATLNPAGKY